MRMTMSTLHTNSVQPTTPVCGGSMGRDGRWDGRPEKERETPEPQRRPGAEAITGEGSRGSLAGAMRRPNKSVVSPASAAVMDCTERCTAIFPLPK